MNFRLAQFFRLYHFIKWFLEDSQKSINNRFDFLDGYRGFCALVVVLNHYVPYIGSDSDFLVFKWTGHFIGVFGFFVLSAFLLTYRMTKDLEKTTNKKDIFEILVKYFIRRFFRIYIPFMFFITCVKYGPDCIKGGYGYNTWWQFLTLKPDINNHLWSVPVEIHYYFLIPIFCLIFYYSKKLWSVVIVLKILFVYWLYQTYFKFSSSDLGKVEKNTLPLRFPIFFSGTIVAFLYLKYESLLLNSNFKLILKSFYVRFSFGACSFVMALYGLHKFSPYYNSKLSFYDDLYNPGIKFSYLLFFMLIGAPNDFTRLFGNNYFLTKIGKFSFGVYMWHPMCIVLTKSYQLPKRLDQIMLLIAMSQLCGFLFYYFIENPMMKIGNWFISRVNFKKYEPLVLVN